MNVTRNVIADLLPLYESGEASEDTRRLVDDFRRGDPEFARLMETPTKMAALASTLPRIEPEREMEVFRQTRRLVWLRDALFWIGWFLSIAPLTAYDTSWGSGWLPFTHPWAACALAVAAGGVWYAYHLLKRRLSTTGF